MYIVKRKTDRAYYLSLTTCQKRAETYIIQAKGNEWIFSFLR